LDIMNFDSEVSIPRWLWEIPKILQIP
jgi:hypothetical protein